MNCDLKRMRRPWSLDLVITSLELALQTRETTQSCLPLVVESKANPKCCLLSLQSTTAQGKQMICKLLVLLIINVYCKYIMYYLSALYLFILY